jgi:hypothetical protein
LNAQFASSMYAWLALCAVLINSLSALVVVFLLFNFFISFDGTLGDWKTKQVSFQLKEGVSPYHGRAFPEPKIHKDTIMKEVERLCKLGVLEKQPASEWALPSFIVPKKDKIVCFLSEFWEVNKRLVKTPFPIPKLSMVLQEIEGFSFAKALDLNMGYYTIRLDPDASKICIIIFPWGKIFLQAIANGYCRFSRHFPRKDVRADGILGVCKSLS